MSRSFQSLPAVRTRVPLIIALGGASGSGKTKSALRLAKGMQKVFGGKINLLDTERKRALHYADEFEFEHTPFDPPYGPGDYSEALSHIRALKPGVCIVDQLSYEHEGIGGVLEMHESELDRMAGENWQKREACNMIAWSKPKAMRRRLLQEIVQIGAEFAIILCFRAKETVKPVKKDGKTVIEDQGFVPIAGAEFLYEATAAAMLYPGSNGIPTWLTEFKGEKAFIKLPGQFKDILSAGRQISEDMGQQLAQWAQGTPAKAPPPAAAAVATQAVGSMGSGQMPSAPAEDLPFGDEKPSLEKQGDEAAAKGLDALKAWYLALTKPDQAALRKRLDEVWKPQAGKVAVPAP